MGTQNKKNNNNMIKVNNYINPNNYYSNNNRNIDNNIGSDNYFNSKKNRNIDNNIVPNNIDNNTNNAKMNSKRFISQKKQIPNNNANQAQNNNQIQYQNQDPHVNNQNNQNNNNGNKNLVDLNCRKNRQDMIPKKQIIPTKRGSVDNNKNGGFSTPDGNKNKNIEFKTPDGNDNKGIATNINHKECKCKICNKEIKLLNTEREYCEECFKQDIFNEYLKCIQDEKSIKEIKEHLENNYKLNKNLDIYNTNFENKLYLENIYNSIHHKKCIFSEKENCYNIKLPCNCNLCPHLYEFLKVYIFKRSFKCICFHRYTRRDMMKLWVIFYEKNKDISKKISDYFQERLPKECCICDEKLYGKGYPLEIAKSNFDTQFKLNQESLDGFIKTFNHNICEKCKTHSKKDFKCCICSFIHFKKI
jgi:hypothetical protein